MSASDKGSVEAQALVVINAVDKLVGLVGDCAALNSAVTAIAKSHKGRGVGKAQFTVSL